MNAHPQRWAWLCGGTGAASPPLGFASKGTATTDPPFPTLGGGLGRGRARNRKVTPTRDAGDAHCDHRVLGNLHGRKLGVTFP